MSTAPAQVRRGRTGKGRPSGDDDRGVSAGDQFDSQSPEVAKSALKGYIEPMSRPRPKVVTLTDAAAARVRAIMGGAGGKPYLRVGVKNGGCAGMEYVLEYADAPDPMDEVVEDKGVRILVGASSILFLLGAEIDHETTRLSSKFTFRNPNQTDACGCGESVTIAPAKAEPA